ncbi:unnamed protein product [Knipowitschia caucasica]
MGKIMKKKVDKIKANKGKRVKRRPKSNGDSSDVFNETPEEDIGVFTAVPEAVRYDDDVEEEDFDPQLSADEVEAEEEDDERKRNKLVQAISSMGKGRKSSRLEERSEAALIVSEFGVNSVGESGKVELSDLIPSATKKAQKQIETLKRGRRTLETPLSRQETERIHRDVAFQKVSEEVSKWKSVIKQNQRSEQLVFPLNQEPSGPKAIEHVVTGWKSQTPLEQEIFALLNANKQPIHNPVLTPAEEESIKAMSLVEAKIRRAELQKARAIQSYYESKTRRERKIKSKKYHKVHNKAKRKEFLKQFDEMVKTNPEAALEELKKLELGRMKERMSLKHQNSGKWAKSKVIMAKYDEDARKAMQQQLEINKELTQKVVTALNNDEEEEEEKEEEVLPDFANDAEQAGDSTNPWMRGKLTEEERENKEVSEMPVETVVIEEESEEEEVNEDEVLLKEFENKRQRRREAENKTDEQDEEQEDEDEEDGMAEEELSKFMSMIRGLSRKPEVEIIADNSTPLEEGLSRIQTMEDAENLQDAEMPESDVVEVVPQEEHTGIAPAKKAKKRKRNIELKQVLTKESKVVTVPLKVTTEEAEDEDLEEEIDQRGLIREAFAGDDVVSDFLKEKRNQENAGKPKSVNLTLPGWGEWGGLGLMPSRKKRKKFRVKAAPAAPRRDAKLPEVIMSEHRDKSIALHQVNSLPFPFDNHIQFESSIRCPMGRTWNSEKTVQKVTQPRVVTQLGAIIEPMGREEFKKVPQANQKAQTPTVTNQRNGQPERRHKHVQKRKKHK